MCQYDITARNSAGWGQRGQRNTAVQPGVTERPLTYQFLFRFNDAYYQTNCHCHKENLGELQGIWGLGGSCPLVIQL